MKKSLKQSSKPKVATGQNTYMVYAQFTILLYPEPKAFVLGLSDITKGSLLYNGLEPSLLNALLKASEKATALLKEAISDRPKGLLTVIGRKT